jgi:hypothetical protein
LSNEIHTSCGEGKVTNGSGQIRNQENWAILKDYRDVFG